MGHAFWHYLPDFRASECYSDRYYCSCCCFGWYCNHVAAVVVVADAAAVDCLLDCWDVGFDSDSDSDSKNEQL